jgi:Ca2+-binding RTX toxin-like protein
LALICGLGLATVQPAAAQSSSERTVHFLIDISGSMRGQKLVDAKTAVSIGFDALAPGQAAGLRSFGGNCNSGGDLRGAPGTDVGILRTELASLTAGGNTPTPSALRAAADDLDGISPSLLVLVSDGQSTCGDPCPVAQQIRDERGIDLQTVIIGFQVAGQAETELQCIADATGGIYVPVDDGPGLIDAIQDAVEMPMPPAPPTPPTPEPPAPPTPPAPGSESCAYVHATIVGTDGPDFLVGTPGDDVIVAKGGNDLVFGLGGNDIICLGDGDDGAHGGHGSDLVLGENGNDIIFGNHGSDIVSGGHGNDFALGGPGKDLVKGDNGNDIVIGNDDLGPHPEADALDGGAGVDILKGDAVDRCRNGESVIGCSQI